MHDFVLPSPLHLYLTCTFRVRMRMLQHLFDSAQYDSILHLTEDMSDYLASLRRQKSAVPESILQQRQYNIENMDTKSLESRFYAENESMKPTLAT